MRHVDGHWAVEADSLRVSTTRDWKWNDRRDSIFGTLTPRADVINDNQQILAKHSFGEATKRQPQFFSAHLRNEVQSGCAAL
jgi:hypothetical protein